MDEKLNELVTKALELANGDVITDYYIALRRYCESHAEEGIAQTFQEVSSKTMLVALFFNKLQIFLKENEMLLKHDKAEETLLEKEISNLRGMYGERLQAYEGFRCPHVGQ